MCFLKKKVDVTLHSLTSTVHSSTSEQLTLLEISLPEGTEMVMPGDNVSITVELINKIAMEKGLKFRYQRRW